MPRCHGAPGSSRMALGKFCAYDGLLVAEPKLNRIAVFMWG